MSDIIALAQIREDQQSEINRSNREKQMILDHVNIPIWLHDGNGELLRANKEVAKIAGVAVDSLDTQTNWDIFSKDFPDDLERPITMVKRTRNAVQLAVPFNGRDYIVHAHPIFDETQKLSYIVKSAIDVTELNSLIQDQHVIGFCLETFFTESDSTLALKHVIKAICEHLNASQCFVMKFDTKKSQATTLAEYAKAGSAVWQDIKERSFNDSEPWYQAFSNHELISRHDMQTAESADFFGEWYDIAGKMKSIYLAGIYLDGQFWGDIGVSYEDQNYTFTEVEQKFIRTAGRMVGLFLQRMKAQEQIISALNQARAADKAKSFFIASVSHEIRTPLNAVIGFAELLKSGRVALEEQKEYLDSIAYSGNALLQLINDVLDLSKLEADQMQIINEPTDFKELVCEVIQVFAPSAAQKHLKLNVDIADLPILEIDKLRIRQILFNLIGNAVKFTPSGAVSLHAEFLLGSDSEGILRFEIEDTGIGINPDDQRKLMEPFVQLSQMRGTNAANNGTGLGLSICKRLAEKMNGKLELESSIGQGSIFRITLPHVRFRKSVKDSMSSVQTVIHTTAPFSSLSLLLVDDVDMNLKVMTAMCRRAGITRITCASSGKEALACLNRAKVDLVLTDMWMPQMNGAELAHEIRNNPNYAQLPIVAVTADIEAKTSFSQEDFTGILFKPITFAKMQTMLESILNQQRDFE